MSEINRQEFLEERGRTRYEVINLPDGYVVAFSNPRSPEVEYSLLSPSGGVLQDNERDEKLFDWAMTYMEKAGITKIVDEAGEWVGMKKVNKETGKGEIIADFRDPSGGKGITDQEKRREVILSYLNRLEEIEQKKRMELTKNHSHAS